MFVILEPVKTIRAESEILQLRTEGSDGRPESFVVVVVIARVIVIEIDLSEVDLPQLRFPRFFPAHEMQEMDKTPDGNRFVIEGIIGLGEFCCQL